MIQKNIQCFYKVNKSNRYKLSNIMNWTDVQVQCLLPNQSVGSTPHDQNIVVKIVYAGRTILLPGDANGALLERIRQDNPGGFNDVDCLLSHHGSNNSGELANGSYAKQIVIDYYIK